MQLYHSYTAWPSVWTEPGFIPSCPSTVTCDQLANCLRGRKIILNTGICRLKLSVILRVRSLPEDFSAGEAVSYFRQKGINAYATCKCLVPLGTEQAGRQRPLRWPSLVFLWDPAPSRSQDETLRFAGSGWRLGCYVTHHSSSWCLALKGWVIRNCCDSSPSCPPEPHVRAAKHTGMLIF